MSANPTLPTDIGSKTDAAVLAPGVSRPSLLIRAQQRLAGSSNVTIHCDGACEPNPGPGGWGIVIDCPVVGRVELFGGARCTTNNRMELEAAIISLAVLPRLCNARVISDSKYVVDGAGDFANGRRKRMRHGRKPVPNADLWQRLDEEQERRLVIWEWIRGHAGHAENELADRLATRGLRTTLPDLASVSR